MYINCTSINCVHTYTLWCNINCVGCLCIHECTVTWICVIYTGIGGRYLGEQKSNLLSTLYDVGGIIGNLYNNNI